MTPDDPMATIHEDKVDRTAVAIDPESIRFPASTLRLVDAIASRLAALLRGESVVLAVKQGRSRVNDEDVFGALPTALKEISRQAESDNPGG